MNTEIVYMEEARSPHNITHAKEDRSFEEQVQILKNKIIDRGPLPHVSVEQQLEVVDHLCEFPLGRYVLEHRGANGFWTDYMMSHPDQGRITGLNIEGKPFSKLEDFFLNHSPVVIASQERFRIFQSLLQNSLKDGVSIASVPCGMMTDILTLDFSKISNYRLVGVDIDEEALTLARAFAIGRGIKNLETLKKDAWKLSSENEFDIIRSNGLNVYEPDHEKVLDLYRGFFKALKPGGLLIIGVLTYPPGEDKESDWLVENMPSQDLLMERILHTDVLDIKWRHFRTGQELDQDFKTVGFSEISIHWDQNYVFPTICARKPL